MQYDETTRNWKISCQDNLTGATVEWIGDDGKMIISFRHRLFESFDNGQTLQPIASIPEKWWKRLAVRLRPLQRLLRAMCYNILEIQNGILFVSYGKNIYSIRYGDVQPIVGLRRPTRILRGGCALGGDGAVYFGEYISNQNRGEIFIYRWVPSGNRVEVVYSFSAKSVRHVHGLYTNPSDGSIWCLSGDVNHECRILRTKDFFNTLNVVGEGDETWRAVSIQFDEKYAYYAMDAEYIPNKIFRLDTITGQRDELGLVNGPVYYSCRVNNRFIFAVTAESCPSSDNHGTLWCLLKTDNSLTKIATWSKDILPFRFFMPGTIHLPRIFGTHQSFWFHGVGLQGVDNRSFKCIKEI